MFVGKLLAASIFGAGLVALAALASLVAGLLLVGDQALVSLSGTLLPSGRTLALVIASWLVSLLPMLAFTSIAVLVSVVARSGIAGVIVPSLVALVTQLNLGFWPAALLFAAHALATRVRPRDRVTG